MGGGREVSPSNKFKDRTADDVRSISGAAVVEMPDLSVSQLERYQAVVFKSDVAVTRGNSYVFEAQWRCGNSDLSVQIAHLLRLNLCDCH